MWVYFDCIFSNSGLKKPINAVISLMRGVWVLGSFLDLA